MSDDLRTLAQAVVDARDDDEARYALGDWLDYPRDVRDTVCVSVARAILAALDAADAQGYARAMGEVVAEVQTRTEAAVSSYYADRSSYREGYSDACDTLCELVQHMAQTRCD